MSGNDIKSNTTHERKTLSLDVRTTNKNQTTNSKVSVEFKGKRKGLNTGKDVRHHGKFRSDLDRGVSKLTDDEFKTRVKALQKAINNENVSSKTIHEDVNFKSRDDGNIKISKKETFQILKENRCGINSNKKTPSEKSVLEKKPGEHEHDKTKGNDTLNKTNIIDELIKLAPKNKDETKTSRDVIRPIVFRSDAFVKRTRFSDSKTENKSENSRAMSKDKCKNFEKAPKVTKKQLGNGLSQCDKKVRAKTNTVDNCKKPQHQKKYEQSKEFTPVQKKQGKIARLQNRFSGEDTPDSFKEKSAPGRFNKRDLDKAINEEDNIRQRSMASINRSRQKNKGAPGNKKPENKKIVREVVIPDSITVGDLANRMAVRASEIVKFLMSVGTLATVNQSIDGETAEVVCNSFGHVAKRRSENDFEQELDYSVLDNEENMIQRSPIVAVMGHVDHGKTTLLDTLRQTSVTKQEAGGITQHVAAYQVELPNGKGITFIDTPGHAAFSKIRERGASITDIIILIVAADDGIKDQTIEVIKEAKKNNVPLIVAINKIDKPDVNVNKIKSELVQHDILLESFGGDVLSVDISAKNNINIDKLLDAVILQAEVLDLKANYERKATCTVIETRIEKGRGIVSAVIVNGGTLKLGDIFVVGTTYGKIRTITDCFGKRIKSCTPGIPAEITGFDKSPEPGDVLVVVDDIKKAHEISERRNVIKNRKTVNKSLVTNIGEAITNSDNIAKVLNVYIKADVYGSLEAIEEALCSIKCPEVKISVSGKNIGIVSEHDVEFAKASNAIIVCFNVGVCASAKAIIKSLGVKVLSNNVVYHLISDVITEMEKLLPSIIEETYIGRALVKKIFVISRIGTIAGCVVTEGIVKRNNSKIKVLRNGKAVYEGTIKSMKHEKDEIKECALNHECGILAEGFSDYVEGDVIECYDVSVINRKIR